MHVVARCNNREFYFTTTEDFELLLAHLRELVRMYEVKVCAYTLMSNHVHMLLQAPKADALGRRLRWFMIESAQAFHRDGDAGGTSGSGGMASAWWTTTSMFSPHSGAFSSEGCSVWDAQMLSEKYPNLPTSLFTGSPGAASDQTCSAPDRPGGAGGPLGVRLSGRRRPGGPSPAAAATVLRRCAGPPALW